MIDYNLMVLRRRLLGIHHMLWWGLLWLLLLRMRVGMVIHVMVLMMVMVIERRIHEVIGTFRSWDDTITDGSLEFTTSIYNRSLVTILWTHVSHTG